MTVPAELLDAEFGNEPFEREEPSKLIALRSYRPFLVDHPDSVPPRAPRARVNGIWRNQHEWFTEPEFRQDHLPVSERDPLLAYLRSCSYSQLVMRRLYEMAMHRKKQKTVEPPPSPTILRTVADYFDIDTVGATTVGLQKIDETIALPAWQEKRGGKVHPEILSLTRRDRVRIIMAWREAALERLASPRIIPLDLTNSALRRIAFTLGDRDLYRTARSRMGEDDDYFPIRVPNIGLFRQAVYAIFKDSTGVEPIESFRSHQVALDKGAVRSIDFTEVN